MAKRIPFTVIFASDEEIEYPSSELNTHGPTVHGWRSFHESTVSPQEIILRFQIPAKICRIQVLAHQYLIPDRIEFWIHYSPKGAPTTPSSQTFDYLGFISLSDNASTKYKSRELQSVAVGPRNGTHLKLRLGAALDNHMNPNKQVALIAVNVIGIDIDPNEGSHCSTKTIDSDIVLLSICDDLSFSMYVEENIAETIRDMELKKCQAVNDERFEYARKLKLCMTALRGAGERLGRYALAKRQAVHQEDFITAKLRKEQIELYRKLVFEQLQVETLLERNGFLLENDSVSEIYAQKPTLPSPPSLQDVASTLSEPAFQASPKLNHKDNHSSSSTVVDSAAMVAISPDQQHSSIASCGGGGASSMKTPNSPQLNTIGRSPKRGSPIGTGSLRRRNKSAPRNSYEDYEERAVPALRHSHTNEFLRECQGAAMLDMDPCRGRSRLNERERRQAALPIIVFGNEMVELFYSRQFQDREEGLTRLRTILNGEEELNGVSAGVNKIARSSTLLLHRAVRDAVFSVFSHACETVRALFVEFVPGKVSHSEVARCVDRLLPELLAKSGDPSPRIHTLAQHTILSIAACPEVREQHLVAPALSRSVGSGTHPRLALSRMQMLEQLVLSQGISTDKQSGLTCRALSECGCSGIHHPAEPVRKVAERVLLLVYKINPRLIRKQLPPDDDITRRNLLYRQLFTEFDKLDLQRRKEMLEANKKCATNPDTTLSPPPPTSSSNTQSPTPPSTEQQKHKTVKYENKTRFGFNGTPATTKVDHNHSTQQRQHSPARHHRTAAITSSPVRRIFKSKSGHSITVTANNEDLHGGGGGDDCSTSESCTEQKQKYNEKLKESLSNEHSRKSSNSDSFEEHEMDAANNHCPFCDWSFTGIDSTKLDKHFWKACPILTKCPQCSQVLEVSALSLHLANECEAKISYIICDRCTEAVHKDLYEIHLMEDFCKEVQSNWARCPLCHEDIEMPLDGGWKVHLLSSDGCPGNARRRSKI